MSEVDGVHILMVLSVLEFKWSLEWQKTVRVRNSGTNSKKKYFTANPSFQSPYSQMETWSLIKSRQTTCCALPACDLMMKFMILEAHPRNVLSTTFAERAAAGKANVRALNEPRKRKKTVVKSSFLLNHKARYEMRICYFRDVTEFSALTDEGILIWTRLDFTTRTGRKCEAGWNEMILGDRMAAH